MTVLPDWVVVAVFRLPSVFTCGFLNPVSGSQEWYTVYEQYRRTNCVVSDLIMGNDFVFRAFAINMVGLSPDPCVSKDSAYIQKTGEPVFNTPHLSLTHARPPAPSLLTQKSLS